ncbi:uncharacterized protein LOC129600526 [Paramacrobiotus metropolitanus]|uniref:uncharacterized protein LOC129600526 n=1 Tax=Paramacrobiotus metropolitanus TaxID=2943436 RepID=UPI0024464687|nr:uncharacterized protein LOC129600526 [Paramacrobiotus metropolitanus]
MTGDEASQGESEQFSPSFLFCRTLLINARCALQQCAVWRSWCRFSYDRPNVLGSGSVLQPSTQPCSSPDGSSSLADDLRKSISIIQAEKRQLEQAYTQLVSNVAKIRLNRLHSNSHSAHEKLQASLRENSVEAERNLSLFRDAEKKIHGIVPLFEEIDKLKQESVQIRRHADEEKKLLMYQLHEMELAVQKAKSEMTQSKATSQEQLLQLENNAHGLRNTIKHLSVLYKMEKHANDGLRRLRDDLLHNKEIQISSKTSQITGRIQWTGYITAKETADNTGCMHQTANQRVRLFTGIKYNLHVRRFCADLFSVTRNCC